MWSWSLPYFPFSNANAVHTCIWELLQFSFISCVLRGRVVSFTSSTQIVKTVSRKRAASTLPSCPFSTSLWLPLTILLMVALSCLPCRHEHLLWENISWHGGQIMSVKWGRLPEVPLITVRFTGIKHGQVRAWLLQSSELQQGEAMCSSLFCFCPWRNSWITYCKGWENGLFRSEECYSSYSQRPTYCPRKLCCLIFFFLNYWCVFLTFKPKRKKKDGFTLPIYSEKSAAKN